MKKSRLSLIGATAALFMAGVAGTGQVAQSAQNLATSISQNVPEIKGTEPKRQSRKISIKGTIGGLDLVFQDGGYGMSPMQYGMSIGSRTGKAKKSNRLRLSHNAKLKRRMA